MIQISFGAFFLCNLSNSKTYTSSHLRIISMLQIISRDCNLYHGSLVGTRNSSMKGSEIWLHGRASDHGAMGFQIDPSWWTH